MHKGTWVAHPKQVALRLQATSVGTKVKVLSARLTLLHALRRDARATLLTPLLRAEARQGGVKGHAASAHKQQND